MATQFQSFKEFWPFYVGEHSKPSTRILHFIGTSTIFPILFLSLFKSYWFFPLVAISAYGFAWYSHFFIEKNRPATFTHPLWSLLGDFKMFWFMCRGKMNDEVERCHALIENYVSE